MQAISSYLLCPLGNVAHLDDGFGGLFFFFFFWPLTDDNPMLPAQKGEACFGFESAACLPAVGTAYHLQPIYQLIWL